MTHGSSGTPGVAGHPHGAGLEVLELVRQRDRRLGEHADDLAGAQRRHRCGVAVGRDAVAVDRDVLHAAHERAADLWSNTSFLAMKRTRRPAGWAARPRR
jgi:hypothetical protein